MARTILDLNKDGIMSGLDNILRQYAYGTSAPLPKTKAADVIEASAKKRAAMGQPDYYRVAAAQDNGTGASLNPIEQDLANLPADQLVSKYGLDGYGMDAERAMANNRYNNDRYAAGAITLGDTATGVGLGFANSLGGVAALGAGLVNDRAGTYISSKLNELNDWARSSQSPTLNAHRRANEVINSISQADNKLRYEQEKAAGSSSFMAGLRRIGRDALDSVANAVNDPTILGDGIAEATGSLLAAGPQAKLLGMAGKAALRGSMEIGAVSRGAARQALRIGNAVRMPATIGAMESGGVYQQTVSQVMAKSHDELVQSSPDYVELVASGMSPEDARIEVAGKAGKIAAALTFPVAAATGKLVEGFESNPLRFAAPRKLIGNMGREGVEEGIQSGFGQFATNVGVKGTADPAQDLLSGVGEQAGIGALYGIGSAGITQGPNLVAGTAVSGAVKGVEAITQRFNARVQRIRSGREASSPISTENLAASAQDLSETLPEIRTQVEETLAANPVEADQEQLIREKLDVLDRTIAFDPAELENSPLTPEARDAIGSSTNRVEALGKASQIAGNPNLDATSRIGAAIWINSQLAQHSAKLVEDLNGALEPAVEGSDVAQRLTGYADVLNGLETNPEIVKARKFALDYVRRLTANDLSAEAIQTPKGKQAADAVVSIAETNPEAVDPQVADLVLEHARAGTYKIGTKQAKSLATVSVIQKIGQTYQIKAKELALTPSDIVSKEIQHNDTGPEVTEKSAAGHVKTVMAAVNSGDMAGASAALRDFMMFAQHMQNKVAALNESLASGTGSKENTTKYQALTPNRKWVKSLTGVWLDPKHTGSVKLAQQIWLDAQAVGQMANQLATSMSELGVAPVELVALDPAMDGKANEIARRYRKGQVQPTVAPEVNTSPTPVEAPTKTETTAETQPIAEANTGEVQQQENKPVEGPEPQLAPRQAEATDPETAKPAEETSTEAQPQDKAPDIVDAYPDLVGKTNWFHKAYRLLPDSRLLQMAQPFADVANGLKSLSSSAGREAWVSFVEKAGIVESAMVKSLEKALDSEAFKGTTNREALLNPKDGDVPVNSRLQGKAFNIVELIDGKLQYNPKLLQAAVLAGMQWLATAVERAPSYDEEQVTKILGTDATQEQVDWFNDGVWLVDAKRSIADKITRYWGVKADTNAPMGFTKGIAEALAAEVIQGLVATKLVSISKPEKWNGKDYIHLEFSEDAQNPELFKQLQANPNAIETQMTSEPEIVRHIGSAPESVAKSQLHGSPVKLKEQQRKAIETAQNTPYRLNMPMLKFYQMLEGSGLLALFGKGDPENPALNVNHAKSIKGYNRSIENAFAGIQSLVSEMETKGEDISQIPVFFEYGITSVGRLQMIGKTNPQANKLVREVLLPTWSKLDLSEHLSDGYNAFMLAIAQHLGIKVHKQPMAKSVADAEAMLTGPLEGVGELLQEWVAASNDEKPLYLEQADIEQIRQALGGELSPGALHAVMEYARFRNASPEELKSFETALYLEADGVTDGPINALVNMTADAFTPEWVDRVNRGGLFFGSQPLALGDYVTADKANQADLYEKATAELSRYLDEFGAEFARDPAVNDAFKKLRFLMAKLLPDVALKDGKLELKRGIAKNPLTVTVYGSGARGIANKITKSLTDALYEYLSENGELPPSMQSAIATLSTSKVVKTKSGFGVQKVDANLKTGSGSAYTLTPDMVANLQVNVLELFSKPLRLAIESLMGDAIHTADLVRTATQVQAIHLKYAFRQAIADALANRPEGERSQDFLSQAEADKILADLLKSHPMIDTGTQLVFVGGTATADVESSEFGRPFDGTLRTEGYLYGPENPGVSGIPYLVISTGDGQMILNALTGEDVPQGVLPVFDGINMGLGNIQADSQKINQAVHAGWMMNPVRSLADSFGKFIEQNGPAFEMLSDEMLAEMKRAFGSEVGIEFSHELLALNSQLQGIAGEIDARKAAMSKAGMSVDHMAGASAPFVAQGAEISSNPAEAAEQLNELMASSKSNRGVEAPATTSEDIAPELASLGSETRSGARLISRENLRDAVSALNIPADQKQLIRAAVNGMATKGWQVVYGTRAQLNAFALDNELGSLNLNSAHGVSLFGSKTIMLISPSSETLAHELIHAATLELTHQFYSNPGSMDPALRETFKRIEKLMDQFVQTDLSDLDPETIIQAQLALGAMVAASEQPSVALAKAAMMNEFMAWTLPNQKLAELGKNTKAHPVARIVKDVLEKLKKLFFRQGLAPSVADDLYSNLRFNVRVVMQAKADQLGNASDLNSLTLFHAASFGENDRLSRIKLGLVGKIWAARNAARTSQNLEKLSEERRRRFAMTAIARRVGDTFRAVGFPMSQQEKSVFDLMVASLGLELKLNSNSMQRAQELYTEVLKKLDPNVFMSNPENPDEADVYQAQNKYNLIVGNYFTGEDQEGRSTLLPAFLALATVNDEFRSILRNMDVPRAAALQGNTLDEKLSNAAEAAMDRFAIRLAGESQRSPDVAASLDAIVDVLAQDQAELEGFIDQHVTPIGNTIDKMNSWIVDSMGKLAQAGADKLKLKAESSDSKIVKLGAQAGTAVLSIFNQDMAEGFSQGLVSLMDKGRLAAPINEFIVELVGRTKENAPVYDMIKATRSFVQQLRQTYRERLPGVIQSKFTRPLTKSEWASLYKGMLKTDLAALASLGSKAALGLLSDASKVKTEIRRLEAKVSSLDGTNASVIQGKAKDLAKFMVTGAASDNLLRNAEAIANLFGELPSGIRKRRGKPSAELVTAIDQLTSLYALEALDTKSRTEMSKLAAEQATGMAFVLDYLKGQRADELAKSASDVGRLNHYKGHGQSENKSGSSLIVAHASDHASLVARGYQRVGSYEGHASDAGARNLGYYFAPLSSKSPFGQGIAQNVRNTLYGVDPVSGMSFEMHGAGRITDPKVVAKLSRSRNASKEPLLPVYDLDGDIIAFERSIDPAQRSLIEQETDLSHVLGIWRGRQLEEAVAGQFNRELVGKLYDIWESREAGREDEFVDLLTSTDPVIQDAVSLFTPEMRKIIQETFGGEGFMVRKSMINDTIGYRAASVGDLWTGSTRIDPKTADVAVKVAEAVLGKDAYKRLVIAEKLWKNFVSDARTTIVVRSVIVPVANMLSNVYQLASRGVPLLDIARSMPRKAAEIHKYHETHIREIGLEAELRAAGSGSIKAKALEAELRSLKDGHKRLSIWPLIEAGEFSAVSEATIDKQDSTLFEGKLTQYMEKLTDKLPTSVRTLGRYALISRDTALFQGLQRAVEYGDFLAKAVLYDDLVKRQGKSSEEAKTRITEEFINFDRMPGRTRSYLENMGILWFWHFKIRSVKIALSTLRNNPLHLLMAGMAPRPEFFGSVGMPVEDNLFSKMWQDKIGYSMGPLQGLHAHSLNPWVNLFQ